MTNFNKFLWDTFYGGCIMEYIFKSKPEFAEPIRVLFLCGTNFNNNDSDKRIAIEKFLKDDSSNRVIILEKYFNFSKKGDKKSFLSYYDINLFNLYNIENLAALTATNVIIIHESISTAGELAMFASNTNLQGKIITLVPEKYSVEEEKVSAFLSLAFWNKKQTILDNEVIRFYPQIKKVGISKDRNTDYTYFPNNTFPYELGNRLKSKIITQQTTNMRLFGVRYNSVNADITYTKDTYVNFEYAVFKNYVFSLLSIDEFRRKIRQCNKIVELKNLFKSMFIKMLKNTIVDQNKEVKGKVKIRFNNQPNLNFDNALFFMIYIMHACDLIHIRNEENNLISVDIRKNTSEIFKSYSVLIQPTVQKEWGD